jgi:MFS family permease
MAGIMIGSWFTRLPELRIQIGLSYGELGAVLLTQMIGLMIAMQLAEPLFTRLGHRLVVWLVAVIVPWSLPLMAAIHGPLPAIAVAFAWGLTAGIIDVGMNALGVRTERFVKRPILSSLLATWGAGALCGSLVTAAAVHAGLSPLTDFLCVAAVLSCIGLVVGKHLLPDSTRPQADRSRGSRLTLRGGWSKAVLILGVVGATAALCETSVSGWCGIFLTEQRGAAVSVASFGYTAFIVAETVTRMFGDRLHLRFGAVRLVRGCLAVTAIGMATVIVVSHLWVDIAGFALQGCGLAVLIPIITGAVGHGGAPDGSDSATSLAIARYSTLCYSGAMAGPAVVGWLAQYFGVGTALALLIPPLLLIGLLAKATAPASLVNDVRAREPELVAR